MDLVLERPIKHPSYLMRTYDIELKQKADFGKRLASLVDKGDHKSLWKLIPDICLLKTERQFQDFWDDMVQRLPAGEELSLPGEEYPQPKLWMLDLDTCLNAYDLLCRERGDPRKISRLALNRENFGQGEYKRALYDRLDVMLDQLHGRMLHSMSLMSDMYQHFRMQDRHEPYQLSFDFNGSELCGASGIPEYDAAREDIKNQKDAMNIDLFFAVLQQRLSRRRQASKELAALGVEYVVGDITVQKGFDVHGFTVKPWKEHVGKNYRTMEVDDMNEFYFDKEHPTFIKGSGSCLVPLSQANQAESQEIGYTVESCRKKGVPWDYMRITVLYKYGIVIGDRIGKYAAPKSSAKAGVWTPYAPAESSSFDEAAYLAELRRKYVIRTGGHLRVLQDFRVDWLSFDVEHYWGEGIVSATNRFGSKVQDLAKATLCRSGRVFGCAHEGCVFEATSKEGPRLTCQQYYPDHVQWDLDVAHKEALHCYKVLCPKHYLLDHYLRYGHGMPLPLIMAVRSGILPSAAPDIDACKYKILHLLGTLSDSRLSSKQVDSARHGETSSPFLFACETCVKALEGDETKFLDEQRKDRP